MDSIKYDAVILANIQDLFRHIEPQKENSIFGCKTVHPLTDQSLHKRISNGVGSQILNGHGIPRTLILLNTYRIG
jgi:hypothetical protein